MTSWHVGPAHTTRAFLRQQDPARKHLKQGSRLVRWAAIEAVAKQRKGSHFHDQYQLHLERRGRSGIAKVAIARKLVRLVFFAMRDHETRWFRFDALVETQMSGSRPATQGTPGRSESESG